MRGKGRALAAAAAAVLLLGGCSDAAAAADARGKQNFEAGNYAQALEDFSEAAQADAEEAVYQVHCGMACIRLEQYEEALTAFEQALTLDSQNRSACRGRGIARMALGQYAEAAADFETALELSGMVPDEEDYDSLHWLMVAYYRAGDYEQSADAAVRLLRLGELAAEDGAFVNDLALRLMEDGANAAAAELLDAAADVLDGDSLQTLRWNRIVLAERMEQTEEALALLNAYCADYPADADGVLERDALADIVPESAGAPQEETGEASDESSEEEGQDGGTD